MARTKQTARRSTGGAAPRIPLGSRPVCYGFKHGKIPLQHAVSKKPLVRDTAKASNVTTSNAQMKVLSSPDILIIILSQLPHSSLLNAKLVNKTWASLFDHVEIKASLFERPRPKGSALYTEAYSDLLMSKFLAPWPTNREGYEKYELGWQWRQLLVCQPPIETLEIVHEVGRRVGGTLEFRTVIPRPGGLRMGFLYDVIEYCHQRERSSVELLWDRKTGDLTDDKYYYPDGHGFETLDDKPCVTIWGHSSDGCGSHGCLTYRSWRGYEQMQKPRIIESGGEEVEFTASEPKLRSINLSLLFPEDEDEDGDGGDEEETVG
ncbi:hypothetical protein V492_08308 [Pseudogymnoascus sp. VKM F-4246]|nr:hypothetical protein V492_08308 [Pseudogymnoascus sp. VKM F-4246]